MIKRLKSKIWVDDYIITFTYKTKRNNEKWQKRLITNVNKESAVKDFWLWIQVNNGDKPYRAMTNVKILDIAKENGRYIEV